MCVCVLCIFILYLLLCSDWRAGSTHFRSDALGNDEFGCHITLNTHPYHLQSPVATLLSTPHPCQHHSCQRHSTLAVTHHSCVLPSSVILIVNHCLWVFMPSIVCVSLITKLFIIRSIHSISTINYLRQGRPTFTLSSLYNFQSLMDMLPVKYCCCLDGVGKDSEHNVSNAKWLHILPLLVCYMILW